MTDESQPAEKPKLRWYQYRLAHLFVLMTVAAIGCSWFACKMQRAKRQREAVEAIRNLGPLAGMVGYNYEYDANGNHMRDAEPPDPAWFRNFVGLDFVADVGYVNFLGGFIIDYQPQVSDANLIHLQELTSLKWLYLERTQVSDAGLEHLQGLTELETLNLSFTQVSDDGLVHLNGLTKLARLELSYTQVTDAGLVHLKGLTKLRLLDIESAQVTDEGVRQLERALPNCDIIHF